MGRADHRRSPTLSAGTDVEQLVASMAPQLHDGAFVFVTLAADTTLPADVDLIASVREAEGLSVVVPAEQADAHDLVAEFPCAWITLQVHSALEAVGFLAVITTALAEAGISTNAVAGFHHDHLFVPWSRRHDAMRTLLALADRPPR